MTDTADEARRVDLLDDVRARGTVWARRSVAAIAAKGLLDRAIRRAVAGGASVTDVATAAGLSRKGVYAVLAPGSRQ